MTRLKARVSIPFIVTLVIAVVIGLLLCKSSGSVTGTVEHKTITDQTGRTVELPEKVKRVDTSYRIATEIIMGLGAGDRLVGVDSASSSRSAFYSKFLPSFKDKPTTGSAGGGNAESIAALKPDIVIVSLVKGPGVAKIKQLESAGLKAIGIRCETPNELILGVRTIGTIVGEEEKAEEYVSYYEGVRDLIRRRLADLENSERVPVFISGSGGILTSCGKKMYQSAVIDIAGGRNVAASISAGGWANISPEQLIRWDPSVILTVQYGHSMGPCPATPEDIIEDSRFSTLTAVKNEKVYMFPSNISPWDYPSMQSVLGLLWVAKTLHPDRFADIDMTAYADDFYSRFFGKSFRDAGGLPSGIE